MISSLVDGAREVRSALAAGGAWLLTARALLPGRIETALSPTVRNRFDEFSALAGDFVVLTALAVVAYLIGSIYIDAVQRVSLLQAQRYLARWPAPNWSTTLRSRLAMPLSTTSHQRIYNLAVKSHRTAKPHDDAAQHEAFAIKVLNEVLLVHTRLLVGHKDLFDRQDRLQYEALLRYGIVLQALILALATPWLFHGAIWVRFVLGMVLATLALGLLVQARLRMRSAASIVAHAVADRTIQTASLDSLNRDSDSIAGRAS